MPRILPFTLLFAALLTMGCATPEVALENALLKKLSTSALELGLNLSILNPNQFALPLQQVEYDLDLFQADFTKGAVDFTRNIPANQRVNVEVPLGIKFSTVSLGVQNFLSKPSIPWGIDGACSFRTPRGPVRIGFAKSGQWDNPLR